MSLVAEFPDRAPVVLSGIAGDDPQPTWPGGDTRAADGQVAAYSAPGSAATHAYCARPRSATGANMTDAMAYRGHTVRIDASRWRFPNLRRNHSLRSSSHGGAGRSDTSTIGSLMGIFAVRELLRRAVPKVVLRGLRRVRILASRPPKISAMLNWNSQRGEVAEWSIAPASKAGVPLRVPGVRISPSPPALPCMPGR